MRRIFGIFLLAILLVWGPSYFTGWQATRQAQALSGGQFCWLDPTPSRDGTDLTLTRDPKTPYRFWKALFARDPVAGHTLPHFALVIPNAEPSNRLLAWSYRQSTFWTLEHEISALGLFWASEDCAALLAL